MKQKGFTLIELLVVVAIIGILAAVGVVAYSGYTSGAKTSSTKSLHNAYVKMITSEILLSAPNLFLKVAPNSSISYSLLSSFNELTFLSFIIYFI